MSGEPSGLFNSILVHIHERTCYSSSTEREVSPAVAESQRLCGFWSSREKLNRLGAGCRKRARWLGYRDERLRAGMRNNMFLAKGAIIAMKEPCGWPIKKGDYSWAWRSWQKRVPGCWICQPEYACSKAMTYRELAAQTPCLHPAGIGLSLGLNEVWKFYIGW